MNRGAIAFLVAVIVLMAAPADAYIDPGTGGFLIQLMTGGVAGLLVLARLYWSRIKGLFARPSEPKRPADALPQQPDPVENDRV